MIMHVHDSTTVSNFLTVETEDMHEVQVVVYLRFEINKVLNLCFLVSEPAFSQAESFVNTLVY